jgi:hypothetical protein
LGALQEFNVLEKFLDPRMQLFDLCGSLRARVVQRLVQLAELGPFGLQGLDPDFLPRTERLLGEAVLLSSALHDDKQQQHTLVSGGSIRKKECNGKERRRGDG